MERTIAVPSAPTITAFGSLVGVTTILTANNRRVTATIFNGMDVTLYVLLGAGAVSTTNYSFKLSAGQFWEMPGAGTFCYKNNIRAIQAGGTSGEISVQEWTD